MSPGDVSRAKEVLVSQAGWKVATATQQVLPSSVCVWRVSRACASAFVFRRIVFAASIRPPRARHVEYLMRTRIKQMHCEDAPRKPLCVHKTGQVVAW